jgi:hypothetical protein
MAKDLENDALRESREVLEEDAEAVSQMALLMEERAGLEGAEAQAGFRERAGFAAAGEGAGG